MRHEVEEWVRQPSGVRRLLRVVVPEGLSEDETEVRLKRARIAIAFGAGDSRVQQIMEEGCMQGTMLPKVGVWVQTQNLPGGNLRSLPKGTIFRIVTYGLEPAAKFEGYSDFYVPTSDDELVINPFGMRRVAADTLEKAVEAVARGATVGGYGTANIWWLKIDKYPSSMTPTPVLSFVPGDRLPPLGVPFRLAVVSERRKGSVGRPGVQDSCGLPIGTQFHTSREKEHLPTMVTGPMSSISSYLHDIGEALFTVDSYPSGIEPGMLLRDIEFPGEYSGGPAGRPSEYNTPSPQENRTMSQKPVYQGSVTRVTVTPATTTTAAKTEVRTIVPVTQIEADSGKDARQILMKKLLEVKDGAAEAANPAGLFINLSGGTTFESREIAA